MALAEAAAEFAREVLTPGGAFLCKVLQGGTEATLLAALKRDFASVKHVKPAASRADSAELYLLATGFRGSSRMRDRRCSSVVGRWPPARSPPRRSAAPACAGELGAGVGRHARRTRTARSRRSPRSTMKAGWKSAAVITGCARANAASARPRARRSRRRPRSTAAGRPLTSEVARLMRRLVDLGIGDGVDAGELQRAEEAADHQDADDPGERHAGREGRAGRRAAPR